MTMPRSDFLHALDNDVKVNSFSLLKWWYDWFTNIPFYQHCPACKVHHRHRRGPHGCCGRHHHHHRHRHRHHDFCSLRLVLPKRNWSSSSLVESLTGETLFKVDHHHDNHFNHHDHHFNHHDYHYHHNHHIIIINLFINWGEPVQGCSSSW